MTPRNRLMAQLSGQDQGHLLAIGEDVRLVRGGVVFEQGEDAASVLFPRSGAVVLAVSARRTAGLGILLVGREGMLGMHRVLGDRLSPLRAVAQSDGDALRIDACDFDRALNGSLTMRGVMLDYVAGVLNHIAAAVACARFQGILPRLAGWLLMSRDRAASNSLHITQDALALTLGVRRVGVTKAACELQRLHLIDYHRGDVNILDVAGLRAVAGHSYFADPAGPAAARRRVK